MNMEKSRKAMGRVILFFVIAAVFLSALSFSALAVTGHDYTRPGFSAPQYNETVDSVSLLEDILGVTLTEAERAYLNEEGTFSLSYPKSIPSSYITLVSDGAVLYASAKPYTYTTEGGVAVECIPKLARPVGTAAYQGFPEEPDSEGEYKLSFNLGTVPEDMKLEVEYSMRLTLSKDDVNSVLLKSYRDAEYLTYLLERESYDAALLKYNQYLKEKKVYDERLAAYNTYLEELEKFNTDTLLYEEYQEKMKKYEADYLLYLESEKKAESLADEIASYNAYLAELAKVEYRFYIMQETKTKSTALKRSIYDAIYGGAVAQVLGNQSALVLAFGASEKTISAADSATTTLKTRLKPFFEKKTDEEKYIYYLSYYRFIAPNISTLFAALDELYTNDKVRAAVEDEGKSEKFEILLAQLYYAAHAFSDGTVYKMDGKTPYTSSYKIKTANGYKSPAEIIGDPDYYAREGSAKPAAGDVYPTEVAKPDYTPFPKPELPTEVTAPTAPQELKEPTAPETVEEPIAPTPVENFGVSVLPPFSEGSVFGGLVGALENGALPKRDAQLLSADLSAELSLGVIKALNAETATVTYHDADGNHVGDVTLDVGSFADISYTPTKPETERASYVFDSWVDGHGNPVNLASLEGDVLVYPKFREIIKTCDITWIIDGKELVEKHPYGTVPVFSGVPEMAGELSYYYSFSGWDREPAPVSQNESYTAVFEKHYTVPELPSDGALSLDGEVLRVDASNSDILRLDISRAVELAAGKYSLDILFRNASLSFSYSELLSLAKASARYIELSSCEGEYSVMLLNSSAEPLSESFALTLAFASEEPSSATKLFLLHEGERQYLRYSYSDGKISFNLNTGAVIYLANEYSVSVFSQDGISLLSDRASAFAGESVSLSYTLPLGMRLLSLYYVGGDGVKHGIDGDSFIMPEENVRVGAELERIKYTVSFVADGVTISTLQYFLGEEPRVPQAPDGFDDGEYVYTFAGWSPEISAATADVTYTALYKKSEMLPDEGGLKLTPGVMRLFVTGCLVLAVFLLGALPSFIISAVLFSKRRKRGIASPKMLKFR